MTPESAEQVLLAGASLRLKATTPEHCSRLARAARAGGSHVTFVGLLSPESMVAVGVAAPGRVTFEIE